MTIPELEIRPANVDDWATIADFNCRLALETEGKSLIPQVIEAGVKTLLANPRHGRYFVAQCAGQIVGQMMHTFEWSDWRNGEIWWLQSVYVTAEYRSRGVFRALFSHIEQAAQSSPGVIGLRLYVEAHNEQAQSAYRNLGLRDAGYLVMERMLRNALQGELKD